MVVFCFVWGGGRTMCGRRGLCCKRKRGGGGRGGGGGHGHQPPPGPPWPQTDVFDKVQMISQRVEELSALTDLDTTGVETKLTQAQGRQVLSIALCDH